MKIKPEHYETLKAALDRVITSERFVAHREVLKTDPRVKDLDKRLRWDALYSASCTSALPQDFIQTLYEYLNDEHIDTALRAVVAKVKG